MQSRTRVSASLVLFAACLAFIVVTLGAYTRITDAGLGCPDWPGCYKHLTAPGSASQIQQVAVNFPGATVHVVKAWTEMIHRYVAGTLALLVLVIAFQAYKRRNVIGQPVFVPFLLVALIIFQVLLGMWTVTMRLAPEVVMGHLLGGMAILALLWWLYLKLREPLRRGTVSLSQLKPWALLALVVIILQIALGGWTSANYASLICPGFPACTPEAFFPQADFQGAFHPFQNMTHLQPLSPSALITIQMTHRIGAMFTGLYLGFLALLLITAGKIASLRKLGVIILLLLIIQISLGVLNVMWLLPLPIAVAHNTVAALLLLSIVTLNTLVFRRNEGYA